MNDAILASVTNVREVEKEVVLAVKKALQVVEKEERAKLEEKEESVPKGSQTSEKMEKEVEEREEIVGKTSDLMTEEKNEAGIEEFSKEEHGENSNDEMVELGESQDDFLKGDFLSKLEQVKENSEEQEENEAENGLNVDKVEGIEEEKIEEFETHYFSPASFLSGEKLVEITSTGIKERPPWKNVDLPDCTQLGEKFEKLTLSESGEKEMSNDCLETPKEVPQKSTFDLELRTEKEDLSGIENVMFQRVSLLNLEQRLALGAIVATRALVSGLLDELKEVRESGIRRVSSGGLGQVLKKHVSRLEAEKTAAALERAKGSESVKKIPKKPEEAVDSLSFVLKKHVSRLERDLQNSKISERSTMKARSEAISGSEGGGGLGDVLVKHKSKLQKEIEAAKSQGSGSRSHSKQTPHNLGGKGLGETLVKHRSRLERDIERNKGKDSFSKKDSKAPDGGKMEEFGEVLVKHKSKLQREQELFKMESEEQENEKPGKSEFEKSGKIQVEEGSGLGDILVKSVSRLEQMKADRKNQEISRKGKKATVEVGWEGVGLGDVLSKKVSRLEREKVQLSAFLVQLLKYN